MGCDAPELDKISDRVVIRRNNTRLSSCFHTKLNPPGVQENWQHFSQVVVTMVCSRIRKDLDAYGTNLFLFWNSKNGLFSAVASLGLAENKRSHEKRCSVARYRMAGCSIRATVSIAGLRPTFRPGGPIACNGRKHISASNADHQNLNIRIPNRGMRDGPTTYSLDFSTR